MVYPHSNDLGKNPPPSKPDLKGYWVDMFNEEMNAIKHHVLGNMVDHMPMPKVAPKKSGKTSTIAILDELIKDVYSNPWNQKPEPVLIEGPKFKTEWEKNPDPFSPIAASAKIPVKQQQIRFEIKGLTEKTLGVQYSQYIPPQDLTEKDLRGMLTKIFMQMTDNIIDTIKKEKGIK